MHFRIYPQRRGGPPFTPNDRHTDGRYWPSPTIRLAAATAPDASEPSASESAAPDPFAAESSACEPFAPHTAAARSSRSFRKWNTNDVKPLQRRVDGGPQSTMPRIDRDHDTIGR